MSLARTGTVIQMGVYQFLDLVKDHTKLHVLLAGREASVRTLFKNDVPRLQITKTSHKRGYRQANCS